jgi:hypothetical protein
MTSAPPLYEFGLISLWDFLVEVFKPETPIELLRSILIHVLVGKTGADRLRPEYRQMIAGSLEKLQRECVRLKLPESEKHVGRMLEVLAFAPHDGEAGFVEKTLQTFTTLFQDQLSMRLFLYVDYDKTKFFKEPESTFSPEVLANFGEARDDLLEAARCYALDRNTACVFHLMRVAENGLRALARERRVKLPKKKLLEWAQWNDIIVELTKSADALANRKAGPARDEAVEFYRGAIGQFQGFKDAYRNHVMHARKGYDSHQAASVLFHVRDFMNRLALKTDQRGKRIKWGRI